MGTNTHKRRFALVKLESYQGEDTFVHCGDDKQDYMFLVIAIDRDGTAEIVDSGYRSLEEACTAWPEARPR